ncbi:DUF3293 domain-containing protein [Roseococcus sp. YIM B11640]|uniref:DUF3293 domain-containing protein n=1 Tax=Roseococcus sp. YIM B11640 TaxID=3133973 RepID=UPI003C7E264D
MSRDTAYRRTVYRAGPVVVRVGRPSASADAWMARHRRHEAWFIGAWNPLSRRMRPRWNAGAHARLARELRVFEEGEGQLAPWREDMFLAAADAARIRLLMWRFRQAAVVRVTRGRPARLVYR